MGAYSDDIFYRTAADEEQDRRDYPLSERRQWQARQEQPVTPYQSRLIFDGCLSDWLARFETTDEA